MKTTVPPEIQEIARVVLVEVGARIKEARQDKRLNQRGLAAVLGIDQNSVSKYEQGEIDLSITRLIQIAHALEIDFLSLLMPKVTPETKPRSDAFVSGPTVMIDTPLLAEMVSYLLDKKLDEREALKRTTEVELGDSS